MVRSPRRQRAVLNDQPRDDLLRLGDREPRQVVHEAHTVLVRQLHLDRHLGRVLANQALEVRGRICVRVAVEQVDAAISLPLR